MAQVLCQCGKPVKPSRLFLLLRLLILVVLGISRDSGGGLVAALRLAFVLIEARLYLPLGRVGLWQPGLELSVA